MDRPMLDSPSGLSVKAMPTHSLTTGNALTAKIWKGSYVYGADDETVVKLVAFVHEVTRRSKQVC